MHSFIYYLPFAFLCDGKVYDWMRRHSLYCFTLAYGRKSGVWVLSLMHNVVGPLVHENLILMTLASRYPRYLASWNAVFEWGNAFDGKWDPGVDFSVRSMTFSLNCRAHFARKGMKKKRKGKRGKGTVFVSDSDTSGHMQGSCIALDVWESGRKEICVKVF